MNAGIKRNRNRNCYQYQEKQKAENKDELIYYLNVQVKNNNENNRISNKTSVESKNK